MSHIPHYVSAAGLLAIIAAGFAASLYALGETYPRDYVYAWRRMWVALSIYALASGAALLSTSLTVIAPARVLFGAIAIAAAWRHLHWLEEGMRSLCAPARAPSRWRQWTVALLLLVAAALLFVPNGGDRELAMQRYLVRVSLLAVAWGLAYKSAAWMMLRTPHHGTQLGRRTLGWSLFAYGVLRTLEPLTHFLGPSPVIAQFLTFGGLPLLVAVATGMAITLLEVERGQAIAETEARHTAERTANASEALLATALSSSTDPAVIVDPRGRLMVSNDRFDALLKEVRGIEAKPGMPIDALVGIENMDFWRDAFGRALCGEAQTRVEPFVLAPGQAPSPFGIRVTPVRREGEIVGVLILAHNATEEERLRTALARRERWFRSMIENSSDVIFQISPDGSIDYASPSIERITGHAADRIVGEDAFSFVHPDDAAALRDAMEKSFAHDDSVPSAVPFRARTTSGEYVFLEAVSRPYTEADGTPRLIVSARDVGERRRLESELLAARRLESVGRLAGGVAHDFNNLLTAVGGNLSLIRSHDASAPVREHLDEIEHAVQRGAELTRRLLAFARRQTIEPRVVQLGAQVATLERLLRRLIGDEVTLNVALPDALWSVRVDPLALEQIFVNLAVNARDAMPRGGAIRIVGENLSLAEASPTWAGLAAGDWVRVDVSDTGSGIDEAILGQIFEPFFTTKGESGTGLGLATVYGAIRQAGGQIRVHSSVGSGTTFSLFFPRVVDASVPVRSAGVPVKLPRAQSGEVILLIEDEESVREVTAKLLGKLGYRVVVANDGLDGVDKAAEHEGQLALVLSDLMMPELGGVEAVTRIREIRPDLPAVFISGYSEKALEWGTGMPAGGRLIAKPFSLEELARAIRDAIDAAPVSGEPRS